MNRLFKGLLIAGGLLFLIIAGNFVHGWNAAGPLAKETPIVIKSGASIRSAAGQLEDMGAIKSADAFVNRARIFRASSTIKTGEFLIPAHASNADILSILTGGKTVQRMVTVPEGMPSIMVYERLMANDRLTGKVAVPAEGSILPDSYAFEKGEARAAVVARMQAAMKKTIDELWPKRSPDTVVKTPKEAVTLASIVEKETSKKIRTAYGRWCLFQPAENRHDAASRPDDHLSDYQGQVAGTAHPPVRNRIGERL